MWGRGSKSLYRWAVGPVLAPAILMPLCFAWPFFYGLQLLPCCWGQKKMVWSRGYRPWPLCPLIRPLTSVEGAAQGLSWPLSGRSRCSPGPWAASQRHTLSGHCRSPIWWEGCINSIPNCTNCLLARSLRGQRGAPGAKPSRVSAWISKGVRPLDSRKLLDLIRVASRFLCLGHSSIFQSPSTQPCEAGTTDFLSQSVFSVLLAFWSDATTVFLLPHAKAHGQHINDQWLARQIPLAEAGGL